MVTLLMFLPVCLVQEADLRKEVDRAIHRLGSEDFDVREAASKQLHTILQYPREALRRAKRSRDRERAERAETLLIMTRDKDASAIFRTTHRILNGQITDLSEKFMALLEHSEEQRSRLGESAKAREKLRVKLELAERAAQEDPRLDVFKQKANDAIENLSSDDPKVRSRARERLEVFVTYPHRLLAKAKHSRDPEVATLARKITSPDQKKIDLLNNRHDELIKQFQALLNHVPGEPVEPPRVEHLGDLLRRIRREQSERDAAVSLWKEEEISVQPADPALLMQLRLDDGLVVRKLGSSVRALKLHDVILNVRNVRTLRKRLRSETGLKSLTVLRKGKRISLKE